MIGLLKEAHFQINNRSPGVNAWARENVPLQPSYTLMISCSFDFDKSSIFEM